jgi:hypothetical protein
MHNPFVNQANKKGQNTLVGRFFLLRQSLIVDKKASFSAKISCVKFAFSHETLVVFEKTLRAVFTLK